jgi:hypothetical protein
MRLAALFIALFQASTPIAAPNPPQATGTALCDAVSTQIHSNGNNDPLPQLSQGNPPYIELSSKSDMRVIRDNTQFVNLFRDRFNPSRDLTEALDGFPEADVEVFSLPDSDLHMAETSDGTAHCESFRFFQTAKGRESEPLPNLPPKGTGDGINLICSRYGDDGHLARIAGIDVFLESISDEAGVMYQLRIVPFQQGRWAGACRVEADYSATGQNQWELQSVHVIASR